MYVYYAINKRADVNIHKHVTNDLSHVQYIYQYQESILLWTLTSINLTVYGSHDDDIMYH